MLLPPLPVKESVSQQIGTFSFFLIDMQIATDYNIEVLTISAMDESVSDSFAEVSSWCVFVYLYILRKEEVIQNKNIITF